jgi:hypothetical protein
MLFKDARAYLLDHLTPKGFVAGKVNTDRSFILVAKDGAYVGLSDMQTFLQITFVNCPCSIDLNEVDDHTRVVEEINGTETVLKEPDPV